ncbi:MAG: triphosphoribosyl-dephospho-CoA synthase [Rhodospirillales bacterium]
MPLGVRGAREEAADGFPLLFSVALPALRAALRSGDAEAALVETLFVLIARLDDTNLLHRGGRDGLAFACREASAFLDAGSVSRSGWQDRAVAIHRAFVIRRLSPGGAADMLAAAWFVHRIESIRMSFGGCARQGTIAGDALRARRPGERRTRLAHLRARSRAQPRRNHRRRR